MIMLIKDRMREHLVTKSCETSIVSTAHIDKHIVFQSVCADIFPPVYNDLIWQPQNSQCAFIDLQVSVLVGNIVTIIYIRQGVERETLSWWLSLLAARAVVPLLFGKVLQCRVAGETICGGGNDATECLCLPCVASSPLFLLHTLLFSHFLSPSHSFTWTHTHKEAYKLYSVIIFSCRYCKVISDHVCI